MEKSGKIYFVVLLVTLVLICALASLFTYLLTDNISKHTEEVMEQEALNITEDRLRERVENMIIYIDQEREKVRSEVRALCEYIGHSMLHVEDEEVYERADHLMPQVYAMEYGQAVRILLKDKETGAVTLFANGSTQDVTEEYAGKSLLDSVVNEAMYELVSFDSLELYVYALQEDLDEITKDYIHSLIHASVYGTDGYVWINQIVNYEGGDDYAIRLIHPYLSATEGSYLSTDITDAKGGYPYLTELNGVRENGEVFHTYYFSAMSDGEMGEKASYAKLYEPYDWIVATGESMEVVRSYADDMEEYNREVFNRTLRNALLAVLAVFALGIGFIVLINRNYRKQVDTYVEIETKQDPLTGALSRKTGEVILLDTFRKFKQGKGSSLIMMLDIDNFKKINDHYGHDMGDAVLSKISREIMDNIRETDRLFRWGGEEFVLLYTELDQTRHRYLGDKILNVVRELSFESGEGNFGVTISIGGACFKEEDDSWTQALKRADASLYESKRGGKDRYTGSEELPELEEYD